jgi:protein-S-isoprenylcysteine O-methyltransferase Ste14
VELLDNRGKDMGNLISRSASGLAFLLLVMSLALFGSAASLSFWQATVYLSVFGGCSLLITAYLIVYDQKLLASRVKAGPIAEAQTSQKVIQSLASLFFIGLFILAGLDHRFRWSNMPPAVSLASDGFVALGFFVVFLVFRENSYTSAIIEVANEQRVIDSGPYRTVRHPMYAGASVLLLFSPLALGSWVALPFTVPLLLVIAARLLQEEKFLAVNLSGYEAYCQKVRYRLVPFLW